MSVCELGLLMILLDNLKFSAFDRSKNGGAPNIVYNESDIMGGNRVTSGCHNTTEATSERPHGLGARLGSATWSKQIP